MAVYTHNVAADIVDCFDDLLTEHGIIVPSEEDDQRDEDNDTALYGMVYARLLDEVENIIVDTIARAKEEDVIPWVFE